MGVKRILPVFAISAILLASGFGLNSAFSNPEPDAKIKFDKKGPILIDITSSEPLLISLW